MPRSLRAAVAALLAALLSAPATLTVAQVRLPASAIEQLREAAPADARQQPAPSFRLRVVDPVAAEEQSRGVPTPLPGQDALDEDQLIRIALLAEMISRQYVDPIDSTRLFYGAMKGMAKELDEHSQFFTPDEFKSFLESLSGTFSGIGAGLAKKEKGGPQVILYTMPNSPAEAAGLKSGDAIIEVDGHNVGPLEQDEVIGKIRGPSGTPVTLKIARKDAAGKVTTLTVPITRASVVTANILAKKVPGKPVGYLYFNEFREDTDVAVIQAIQGLVAQGATSLVVDLRNNPGGRVDTVVNIVSAFLRKGQAIVDMRGRSGPGESHAALADGPFKDLPVKVLVNGYSASASEILAGALQDHRRATVYGTKTYGKGSAQSILTARSGRMIDMLVFSDGSALKMTMNRWYTPSGRSIDKGAKGGGGVTPDVVVAVADEDDQKAVAQIVRELNAAPPDPAPAPDAILDRALQ